MLFHFDIQKYISKINDMRNQAINNSLKEAINKKKALDSEKIALIEADLLAFNTALQCYQKGCINNCTTSSTCSYTDVVQPKYTKLMATIDSVLSSIKVVNNDLVNYDGSMNIIRTNYSNLISLRNDLDQKMKQLTDIKEGPKLETIQSFDQTIYTNLLLTIIVVFFGVNIFMKLKD